MDHKGPVGPALLLGVLLRYCPYKVNYSLLPARARYRPVQANIMEYPYYGSRVVDRVLWVLDGYRALVCYIGCFSKVAWW